MNKLNLGCGKVILKDYVNLDSVRLEGVNIVHDLNVYPYPIDNNMFDEVLCDNILEHLNDIIKPMEEIHRISKNGAKIIVKVPFTTSIGAFSDPTHKSFYTYYTFNYFRKEDLLNYYTKARFKIINRKIVFHKYISFFSIIFNLSEKMQKVYCTFFYNLIPASSLYFELEVEK